MEIYLDVGPLKFSFDTKRNAKVTESGKPDDKPAEKTAEEKKFEQEKKWAGWQANASSTGGQFGFGSRELTAIEHHVRRWDTAVR